MSDKPQERTEETVREPAAVSDMVSYQEGSIVSRILLKNASGSVTAFAFDKVQAISEHSVPFDALVLVLDGEADIKVGGESKRVRAGEALHLPAIGPHAVSARASFKMVLTMLKQGRS